MGSPLFLAALVAVLYFSGAKLGMLTLLPEGMALFWPANAVVLAALVHTGGRQVPLLACVVLLAEMAAGWPAFALHEAALFGLINFGEAWLAWRLLAVMRFEARFASIADVWKFLLAGPVYAAFASALAGATVYALFRPGHAPYVEHLRTWWLGDALGLLVFTPLLLGFPPFAPSPMPRPRFRRADAGFWIAALLGAAAFATRAVPIVFVLPFVLYVGARYPARWAMAAVALVAVALVVAIKAGMQPFGAGSVRETVLDAQQFIFLMAVMGLGFAALLARLRAQRDELELRVAERTEALRRANDELSRLAFRDSLTGLANRRVFDDALATETARAERYGGALSLVMADIDYFKRVNDTHGHAVGDEVLRVFGSLLRDCARESDVVARYGGEEFAILLPSSPAAAAAQYADRVRRMIAERVIPPLAEPLTCSFGVAQWRAGGDARSLMAEADAALYAAKRQGRNRVVSPAAPVGA